MAATVQNKMAKFVRKEFILDRFEKLANKSDLDAIKTFRDWQ